MPRTSDQPPLWQFSYAWADGPVAAQDSVLMRECSALFSRHYGTWGPGGPRPGEPVAMSPERIATLLDHPSARLATARHDAGLVGYAAALRLRLDDGRLVAWVTQLVVHEAFRDSRAATNLLYSIWQFSDIYACGLVTANPLAVRALETATRRTCRPPLIAARAPDLLPALSQASGYIPDTLLVAPDGRPAARVDTNFHVSREAMPALRKHAARSARPWALGEIGPGEEWVAITFGDQPPTPPEDSEIGALLRGADDMWIQAYDLMTLDEHHLWRASSDQEVRYILAATGLAGGRVLDIGCGDGRHLLLLADQGFEAMGQEIAPALAERARAAVPDATVVQGDARRSLPEGPFDLVLCLYDVVGSSAHPDDDMALLRNVRDCLRPGGRLALSVMNEAVVAPRLPPENRPGSHEEFVLALERLRPSQAMETTGSVFDPEHIVLYDGVHYRKEQFLRPGDHLPVELVIRDRRYSRNDLSRLLGDAGLQVDEIKPVQAGNWDREPPLPPDDVRAKEWLVLATRPA